MVIEKKDIEQNEKFQTITVTLSRKNMFGCFIQNLAKRRHPVILTIIIYICRLPIKLNNINNMKRRFMHTSYFFVRLSLSVVDFQFRYYPDRFTIVFRCVKMNFIYVFKINERSRTATYIDSSLNISQQYAKFIILIFCSEYRVTIYISLRWYNRRMLSLFIECKAQSMSLMYGHGYKVSVLSFSFALQCYQCNFCEDSFNVHAANIINCTGSCEKAKRNSGKCESFVKVNC